MGRSWSSRSEAWQLGWELGEEEAARPGSREQSSWEGAPAEVAGGWDSI